MTGARPGRPLGDGDELVPPPRAPLHRVRLLLRGDPDLRAVPGDVRPRLQHEPRPPELGGADGLRAPRGRRDPHRRHPVPDLPRAPAPRARPRGAGAARRRGGQLPPRGLGAGRVLLRRPLRQPPDRLRPELHPARAPATSTRPASPRAWSRRAPTTSSSSAFPTTTSTRTGTAPRRQVDSIAKADAMFARIVEAGGGLDAFLDEHAVILTADHAQTAVEHALPLADALAEDWAVLAAEHRPAGGGRDRGQPDLARRRRLHPRHGPAPSPRTHERARAAPARARRGRPGHLAGAGRTARRVLRTGVGPRGHGRARGRGRARRPRVPLPARRPAARRARQPLVGERRARGAGRRTSRAAASSREEYPDALARLWSALTSPARRRRPDLRRRGLRVRRLGRDQPRRRRQPRFARARATRWRRRSSSVAGRSGRASGRNGRCATWRR